MPDLDWQARAEALEEIVILLHWTSRRYCSGRSSYIPHAFNAATRALLALGVRLTPADGTLWARDGMGRAYDGLSDAEAAEGMPEEMRHA